MNQIDDPEGWALVLTGFQNDYCAPGGVLAQRHGAVAAGITAALGGARHLLAGARAAGVLVLHVPELVLTNNLSESETWARLRSAGGGPGMLAQEGSPGADFVSGLEPVPGEFVTPRFRASCLTDTRVPVYLRSNGVQRVVVAGVESHRAVIASVVDAACLDYEVFIPRDAIGGSDGELHDAAVRLLPTWGHLTRVQDMLGRWHHNGKGTPGENRMG